MRLIFCLFITVLFVSENRLFAAEGQQQKQLQALLKRFPKADANGDGKLTVAEAKAYQRKRVGRNKGVKKQFAVDPGWKLDRFPDDAICYKSPDEIKKIYAGKKKPNASAVTAYEKPEDGALRIVGTGHSFMIPGFETFPRIAKAAGLQQPPLLTHVGGGMTGSARYKWEEENGIFQFDGKPKPKLLASIANAQWDAMMWGPYFNDQPEYYECWVEFCLKYNPEMKFYLSDAWPQLDQLPKLPKSEDELTYEVVAKMGASANQIFKRNVDRLNQKFPGRVFIMPTSDAMVLAVREYHAGHLPGIKGIHRFLGGKQRSLWHDRLGHLGPGLGNLEGYVFYATMYGKSPERIEANVFKSSEDSFPSNELDQTFRRIAWEAVCNHPLSGVTDKNEDGIGDAFQGEGVTDERKESVSNPDKTR